jgi:MFS transporter, PAT family, beta-lactamase induction signal transducer AmpG
LSEANNAVAAHVKPKGWKLLKIALQSRKSASMLAFGFSSGLPYALLIGTLNAWLGEVGIKLATIGVLSWIGLAYSFKFLWSPLVDRFELPVLSKLGRRKSWIFLCQCVMVVAFAVLSRLNPVTGMGWFAVLAVIAAIASATQDVAVDAWRIDVADEQTPVELLSPIYQFGYRTASIVGGAFALVLAARMSWNTVFLLMAGLIVLIAIITLRAPDTDRPAGGALQAELSEAGQIDPRIRGGALTIVGVSWMWAISSIARFMTSVLGEHPAGTTPPVASDFMKYTGPWIVVATVLVPLIVAATMNWMKAHGRNVLAVADTSKSPLRTIMNHLYGALVAPLAELSGRLGWGVLIIFGFILTYSMVFNIWGSFAFPFYLDYLHYTKDQVAFASKLFGIIMTMVGVSTAGYLFARIGRLPTLLVGAILPILGNFIYADLADGGAHIDIIGNTLGFNALAGWFGYDAKMTRLLMAITFENISTGIAGAAFVAYVSGIVSKKYTAVQYALLSSLTFLIGSMARALAGQWFDTYGYAPVFRWTAAAGLLAVLFVCLEWVRVSRLNRAVDHLR